MLLLILYTTTITRLLIHFMLVHVAITIYGKNYCIFRFLHGEAKRLCSHQIILKDYVESVELNR